MKASTRAVDRGAHFVFGAVWVRCIGQGHEAWVAVDEDDPEYAPEEAARMWLQMVEMDDALD